MWLFYTLLAAMLWGVGQIFVKKGLQNISALFSNVYSSLLGFFIFVPFSLAHGVNFDKILQILPLTFIAALLFISYYYVIGRGQLAITGTVVGTYPFVTVILSLLFLNENPSIFQIMAIAVIILGTIFVAWPNKIRKVTLGTWLIWALTAVVMIGTADFLIKLLMNQSDVYTYLFTYAFCSLLASTIFIFIDKKGRQLPQFTKKNYLHALIGISMIEIGFFIFHLAINEGLISLVSPIAGIYVAITAILAWIFLKEKIDTIHFVGITLAAIGVILIGIA